MKKNESKIRKMSLNNIEGRLSVSEMEEIMAGSGVPGCGTVGFMYIPAYMLGYPYSAFWHTLASVCLAN